VSNFRASYFLTGFFSFALDDFVFLAAFFEGATFLVSFLDNSFVFLIAGGLAVLLATNDASSSLT
jgi:hypothetical protein